MDIKSSSYNTDINQLNVTYSDNSVYRYDNIDADDYATWSNAKFSKEAFDLFVVNYIGTKIS